MGSGEIRRVLLVDDDQTVLAALARSAERIWNACVASATNVRSARESAQRTRPDLALVDMLLPDGSGIDLIAELRANDPQMWLVLVSGHNSVDSTVRGMRAGADDVLCKPFTLNEVSQRLRCGPPRVDASTSYQAPTIHRVAWEHVQRVYEGTGRNKSEAARQLGVDRNTLKRWLGMPRPNA